jgi:hypothetical protein
MTNYEEIIDLKHKNQKEILELKDTLSEKNNDRKKNYIDYLYNLKFKYLEKEEKAKLDRLKFVYGKKIRNNNQTDKELF